MVKPNIIFVYGSLRKGFHNHGIVRKLIKKLTPASTKGVILYYNDGHFPGIVLADEGMVKGEALEFKDFEHALAVCDELEQYDEDRSEDENIYNRRVVAITLENGETTDAYVYEIAERYQEDRLVLESGDWADVGH